MVFAGMMCSSSIWGSISDKYGRKAVSCVLFVPSFYPLTWSGVPSGLYIGLQIGRSGS